jgi:hypothetical protein
VRACVVTSLLPSFTYLPTRPPAAVPDFLRFLVPWLLPWANWVRDSLVVVLLIFYRDAKALHHFASTSLLQYPILTKWYLSRITVSPLQGNTAIWGGGLRGGYSHSPNLLYGLNAWTCSSLEHHVLPNLACLIKFGVSFPSKHSCYHALIRSLILYLMVWPTNGASLLHHRDCFRSG